MPLTDSEENYRAATKQKAQICSDKQLRAARSQPEFSLCTLLTQHPASTALEKKETGFKTGSHSDAERQFYLARYFLRIKGFFLKKGAQRMAQVTVTVEHSISAVTVRIEGFLREFNYFPSPTFFNFNSSHAHEGNLHSPFSSRQTGSPI